MHIARPVRRVGECSIAFVGSAIEKQYGDVDCQILGLLPCYFNQIGFRTQNCPWSSTIRALPMELLGTNALAVSRDSHLTTLRHSTVEERGSQECAVF
jgi:hypothetical protein